MKGRANTIAAYERAAERDPHLEPLVLSLTERSEDIFETFAVLARQVGMKPEKLFRLLSEGARAQEMSELSDDRPEFS